MRKRNSTLPVIKLDISKEELETYMKRRIKAEEWLQFISHDDVIFSARAQARYTLADEIEMFLDPVEAN